MCYELNFHLVMQEIHLVDEDDDFMFQNYPKLKEVIVHRSMIRHDIIDVFKDPEILKHRLNITVINANGYPEKGEGAGVLRDVLTNFWHEFFISLSAGGTEKTPHIRHDLQKPEWQAIARVLVFGYEKAKYFPVQLSQFFILCCLFGEESLGKESLLQAYRCYVPADDREILDKVQSCELDPNDEDLLEFLSSNKCYKAPTKENIASIVLELAHQELIQKPRYITNCWSPILKTLQNDANSIFSTPQQVEQLYEEKQPTAKKVNKLFIASVSTDAERQSLDFLKRYVKSLEKKALERFLHFLTGSDVLTCDSIEITFTTLHGFSRRPIAHTCGPTLELPTTYECFAELAEEFTSIMRESTSWSFDIV